MGYFFFARVRANKVAIHSRTGLQSYHDSSKGVFRNGLYFALPQCTRQLLDGLSCCRQLLLLSSLLKVNVYAAMRDAIARNLGHFSEQNQATTSATWVPEAAQSLQHIKESDPSIASVLGH